MRSPAAVAAVVFLACAWVASAADRETNYCDDPAAEGQWQELLAKNPTDYDLQALHALRIGLCEKVERGDLTVPQATQVFERARAALVSQKVEQEAQEARKKGSAL